MTESNTMCSPAVPVSMVRCLSMSSQQTGSWYVIRNILRSTLFIITVTHWMHPNTCCCLVIVYGDGSKTRKIWCINVFCQWWNVRSFPSGSTQPEDVVEVCLSTLNSCQRCEFVSRRVCMIFWVCILRSLTLSHSHTWAKGFMGEKCNTGNHAGVAVQPGPDSRFTSPKSICTIQKCF